jgi:coatomer protein complex subunit epsilon
MDPYSPEGGSSAPRCHPSASLINLTELINIHSAFHAGAFQQVLDFDTSSFSSSNALPVRVLQSRSKIALGQAKDVSSELASEKTPDLIAVKLLADQAQGKDVLSQAKKLAEQYGQENLNVQLLIGIVLEKAGETEEALALLSKHQGSLDAYVRRMYSYREFEANNEAAWLLLYKSTSNKTAQIWHRRKHSAHANGHKTAC